MSIKFKRLLLLGLVNFVLFEGCQQFPVDPGIEVDNSVENSGCLVLGKKLENPYSVSSMMRARDSLVTQGKLAKSSVKDAELVATHYYVRFKPKTEAQLVELKIDSSLVLWDYPLDYEIKKSGTFYRDPGIPVGHPNYQYTVVVVGQSLPQVEYEVLEKLVLVPEPEEGLFLAKRVVWNHYYELEHEALRITGNLPETELGLAKIVRWRPSGKIRVTDEYLGNVPVISVNVRARNWFRWWDGYTDNNGDFSSSTQFTGNTAEYSLKWEHPHNRFDIREGLVGQAFYHGPKKRGAWDLDISSGMSWMYAHIFRAAAYYCGPGRARFDFTDPPFNLISIQALDKNASSTVAGGYNHFSKNIAVFRYEEDGTAYDGREFFRVISHELGHAHHHRIYDGEFNKKNPSPMISEAWANVACCYMVSSVYNIPFGQNMLYGTHRQLWTKGSGNYSPLMIDLIDSYNQREDLGESYPQDRVSGYTLKQLETIVAQGGCKEISDFKNHIKALPLPNGITSEMRDEYLDQY